MGVAEAQGYLRWMELLPVFGGEEEEGLEGEDPTKVVVLEHLSLKVSVSNRVIPANKLLRSSANLICVTSSSCFH